MKCLTSHLVVLGLTFALSGVITGSAAPADDAVIARAHFAGFQQMSAENNGTVLKEIWNLPTTVQLRRQTLDKLAAAVAASFQPKKSGAPGSCLTLIRPLLDDLCTAECYAEVSEGPNGLLDCTTALHLNEERTRVWQANVSQLLSGWEPKRDASTIRLSMFATNSWIAVRCLSGPKQAATIQCPETALWSKIRQGQRPVGELRDSWFKSEADLGRLAAHLGHAHGGNLPRVDLTITGLNEYVRSQARLTFRDPVVSRIESWKVPTDTIRDPLISFTALQGFSAWLKRQPLVQQLGLDRLPDQLYLWGLSQTPFQIQAAVPAPNATNAFERIAQEWVPGVNKTLAEYAVGSIRPLTNRAGLMWRGLPILVPYLEPVVDHGREYLHGGIFPVNPSTNPAPTALFEQVIGRTNLLFFEWEITQARLDQLRPLLQLSAAFLTISPMSTNSAAHRWLDSVEPRLGNTATKVTVTSSRELSVLRTSHLGLNGLELLSFANWLEGTNFPRLNLELGFRPTPKVGTQRGKR